MWSLVPIAILSCGASGQEDPLAKIDSMLGQWVGEYSSSGLSARISVNLAREGRLLVVDLNRNTLLGDHGDRIYVDPLAPKLKSATLTNYVREPRVDTFTVGKESLSFRSDPWKISEKDTLILEFSFVLGRFVERPKARIQLTGKEFVPDPSVLTFTWHGELNGSQTAVDTAELRRRVW